MLYNMEMARLESIKEKSLLLAKKRILSHISSLERLAP